MGETDRAGQVAGLVDLQDRQSGVLLVVGAKAAVIGAAKIGAGLGQERPVAGLHPVAGGFPIGQVVADQGLLHPVVTAALEVEDVVVLGDDLGRDQAVADLTQAGGLAQEQIGRRLADRRQGRLGQGRGASNRVHRRSAPRTTHGRG